MREIFVMALSTVLYPFMIFIAAASLGAALVMLRDHLRKAKQVPQYHGNPLMPLDEIYND